MPLFSHPATLLMIDDNPADLRVLIDLLSQRQWRSVVAFDGRDGYNKAILKKPDLILLDVQMPQMDGFATCRLLKANEHTADIPVIFLTAAEDKEARLRGLSLGAVDYIVKPFASEEEVIARIAIHLSLARQRAPTPHVATPTPPDAVRSPLVRAASQILLESFANPPTPDQLASQLGTNEKRLNEVFYAEYGMPVFTWLREQRLHLSRQLLSQTDTSIADIAAHCGYSSPANFSTAFRERFDCSPRDFRRSLSSNSTVT